jgi:hypothetical protein
VIDVPEQDCVIFAHTLTDAPLAEQAPAVDREMEARLRKVDVIPVDVGR